MANTNIIPRATAQRLPIYQHYLQTVYDNGTQRIASQEISEALKYDPATVRRDFSLFGELGKRGYGYDVERILTFFSTKMDNTKRNDVILVGAGNIGTAITRFNFPDAQNINVVAVFDIDDKGVKVVDDKDNKVPVYSLDQLKKVNSKIESQIAILSTPEDVAQEVTDKLVDAGIKGILNFTPVHVDVPEGVFNQNVDLTRELQSLIYFVDNKDHIKSI